MQQQQQQQQYQLQQLQHQRLTLQQQQQQQLQYEQQQQQQQQQQYQQQWQQVGGGRPKGKANPRTQRIGGGGTYPGGPSYGKKEARSDPGEGPGRGNLF